MRELFLKTALLVAYTDSVLGDGEAAIINEYASALGIATSDLKVMETQVKEYLLSHLSHLANVDAAAEIARKLKP